MKLKLILAFGIFASALVTSLPASAKDLLSNGQTIVASFDKGRLKGQKFTLKFNESKGTLGNRKVLKHTSSSISLKTPNGSCKFSSNGKAKCHNGKGTWKLK